MLRTDGGDQTRQREPVMSPAMGAIWFSAIRPSVCPMPQLPSYRHAGCPQLSDRWPPEMRDRRTAIVGESVSFRLPRSATLSNYS